MAPDLNSYYNARMGVEIMKSVVKAADIDDGKKRKILHKIATELSADNLIKSAGLGKFMWKHKLPLGTLAAGAGLATAIPYAMRKTDEYHKNALTMPAIHQTTQNFKQASDNSLASILGASGFGFGKEFTKELSRGVSQGPLSGLSYKLSKNLYNMPTRVHSDEEYGKSLYSTFGKETGNILARRVEDQLKKQQSLHIDKNVYSPMRKQIYDTLLKGPKADKEILAALEEGRTTPDKLWGIYKTMVRFAPRLSTDLTAVKSFFREVIHMGDGETISYTTIKQLADAETAVGKAMESYNV